MAKDIDSKLEGFFAQEGRVKLLEGDVFQVGSRPRAIGNKIAPGVIRVRLENLPRGNLYFDPELTTIARASKDFRVLWDYLMTYSQYGERGDLFSRPVEFSLYDEGRGLGLYLSQKRAWGMGEAVDVFDHEIVSARVVEEKTGLLKKVRELREENEGSKASTFLYGHFVHKREYPGFTIVQRCFLE